MSATPSATPRAVELAQAAAAAAQDKLARDVVGLDVSGQLALTDVFVIASAPSERQVGAVVDGDLPPDDPTELVVLR